MSGIQAALEPADGKKTDARNAHIKLRSNYDAKEVFALINMRKTNRGSDYHYMKLQKRKNKLRAKKRLAATGICLGVIAGTGLNAHAQSDTNGVAIAQLEQQNQALQQQLNTLEDMAKKAGIMPSGANADPPVSAMSNISLSGFVQTSYFYNTENPAGGENAGYLWNTVNDSFDINKVKITIASPPAERSPDKWDAGFRVSLMAGQDAPILNTDSGITGFDYLREAYVDLNVPIGDGLNIKAGDMISLLNYESGDGGAANENFSQGYQWYYTGDGPETGVQLDYQFTDWLDVKFRVENSLYGGAIATANRKGVMGSIGLTPTKNLWIDLNGFGGEGIYTEQADGGEVLAGYQVTPQLGTGFEGDYFYLSDDSGDFGNLWSVGGWIWYNFTSQVGLAFRADYVNAPNGEGIKSGTPLSPPPIGGGIVSMDYAGSIGSLTLTLNYMPAPNIKIQPEIRYNYTTYSGGFAGKDNQFIIGCGASYLF